MKVKKFYEAYVKGTSLGFVWAFDETEALELAKKGFPTKYQIEIFERKTPTVPIIMA